MEKNLTYRDYARFAGLSLEELARQCEAEAFRATGPGGQGVNTTDSAVRMRHVPTGIVVTSRESRSQFQNRQSCLSKIHERLCRLAAPPKTRRKTKPTRASVRRRLEGKRRRSEVKRSRRRPGLDD
ncbi:MAG: peptide chain release factor-like protein [Olsenella sp.]|nr:peptide chain release factor-like protein [Olsenella sp.]